MTTTRQLPLAVMVGVMAALAVFCAGAMIVDDRALLGVSVWLKPFKFAVSFAIFGATLAWMLRRPHKGVSIVAVVVAMLAVVLRRRPETTNVTPVRVS